MVNRLLGFSDGKDFSEPVYLCGNVQMLRKIKDFVRLIMLIAIVLVAIGWLTKYSEDSIVGSARILDGDSLKINGNEIRLLGIDAPEYDQKCKTNSGAEYDCGIRSRKHLMEIVAGSDVECKSWNKDKYDRLLAICYVNNQEINALMVEAGWALAYGDYEGKELIASQNELGLWNGDFENPAKWRKIKKEAQSESWLSQILGW